MPGRRTMLDRFELATLEVQGDGRVLFEVLVEIIFDLRLGPYVYGIEIEKVVVVIEDNYGRFVSGVDE